MYGRGFLDPTVAQVMIGYLPRKALFMTGKEMDNTLRIDSDEVEEVIAAGRWRLADPAELSTEGLLDSDSVAKGIPNG